MPTAHSHNPKPDSPAPAPAEAERNALLCAARAVASSGEADIFQVLVLGAARALGVDLAFIGVLVEGHTDQIRTIAVCDRGEILDNFEYNLANTPCQNVVGQQFRYHAEGIQALFSDPHVKAIGGVGYAAIPLFDSRGAATGLMAVVAREPLRDRVLTECVLEIFSIRAAVELERRNADQARRLSDEQLRATIEAALDCIVGMDERGCVIEFNPAAEETFGYRRGEVLGKRLADLIIPERYREAHAAGMARYLNGGDGPFLGRRVEVTAMRADGSEFAAELAIDLARIPHGRIFIGYLRDITERKRAEEERVRLESQLRQAQKMEAIGQLTGGIAHDFNNILTGAMGYLAMAGERAQGMHDPKLSKYLDRAEHSAQRARALIQEMLTFSRGQRGEPRSLQPAPLLEEAVKLLESSLPSSVEIRTRFNARTPCVMIDPLHLEQVLMNLCINARDAMQGRGTLTIALGVARGDGGACSSCHQPVAGEFVELCVSDNGPGIPDEVVERMFVPFFSTKEVGKGSGMGLSMVHGIVHEYGGHIQVDTRPGEGTAMRIRLPAWFPAGRTGADPGENAHSIAGENPSALLQGRVLLADDESSVREFMQDLLNSWGLSVTVTRHGEDAVKSFAAEPGTFDLAILDQTMPRLTGLDAAEQILRLRPGLPVILYTGYSEHLSEARVIAAGVRALIRKPLDIPAFRRLLEELLPTCGT